MAEQCKVKLKAGRAGRTERGAVVSQEAGQIVEVDVAEGHRLVDTGQAEFEGKAPARPKRIWPSGSPEAIAYGEEEPSATPAAGDKDA